MKNLKTLIAFVLAVSSCDLDAGRHDAWTQQEREELMRIVASNGGDGWGVVAEVLNCAYGNGRTARECRNMANGNTDKNFTQEDDELILSKVNELGKKWTAIAKLLQNKSATSVKARYIILSRKKNIGDGANESCSFGVGWTPELCQALKEIVENNQGSSWKCVTEIFNNRFALQVSVGACKGQCGLLGLRLCSKHKWTPEERGALKEIVENNQDASAKDVAELFNKKCSLRLSVHACVWQCFCLGLKCGSRCQLAQEENEGLKKIIEENKSEGAERVRHESVDTNQKQFVEHNSMQCDFLNLQFDDCTIGMHGEFGEPNSIQCNFSSLRCYDFGVEAQQKYEEADVATDDFWWCKNDFEAI